MNEFEKKISLKDEKLFYNENIILNFTKLDCLFRSINIIYNTASHFKYQTQTNKISIIF